MLIKRRKAWELPESEATPEKYFLNRRDLVKQAGSVAAIGAAPILTSCGDDSSNAMTSKESTDSQGSLDPTSDLYPFSRNESFRLDRPLTEEALASKYNNFYEFGSHKSIYKAAQNLHLRPWDLTIDGLVEKERTIGVDDLIRQMPLEERLYRHRCVEAWSMAVPWSGFPLRALVDFSKPLSGAKYIRMETFFDPDMASGQRAIWYPWPYVEGLTIQEAVNDLAFMVTGVYGKPLAKQFGSPLRLAIPWKYGFKSIKSIVKISFVAERPISFWEETSPGEYGFWANVNPKVDHPRWSQATEEVLGTGERVPTLLFNGYGEQVASLYEGLESERLYM